MQDVGSWAPSGVASDPQDIYVYPRGLMRRMAVDLQVYHQELRHRMALDSRRCVFVHFESHFVGLGTFPR